MSTIRIYKVSEVLGIPSQEVIELLRKEHGIEVKSASSTIEEIVAQQFAERVARKRNLDLPDGQLFKQASTPRRTKKRTTSKKVAIEPPKPRLGPPRLVKAAKSVKIDDSQKSTEPEDLSASEKKPTSSEETQSGSTASTPERTEPVPKPRRAQLSRPRLIVEDEPPPKQPTESKEKTDALQSVSVEKPNKSETELQKSAESNKQSTTTEQTTPSTLVEPTTSSPESQETPTEIKETPAVKPPVASTHPTPDKPVSASTPTTKKEAKITADTSISKTTQSSVPPPSSPTAPRPTGRVVPPTLRLRVEEPKKRIAKAPTTSRIISTTPQGGTEAPLGGPRPLPGQPARPGSSRPLPPRPAVGYRPPPRPPHRPGGKRSAQYKRARAQTVVTPAPPPPITRTITVPEGMTVKDLAERLEVKPKDVLKKLIERRIMMTINTTLDSETATTIAREFGADLEMRSFEEEMVVIEAEETKPEDLVGRAPVVTVMGHVDHGKTTLLDAIRETKVAEGEAGGITQHIGAYTATVNSREIVFLDTPGHEAFTLMRARGAQVTDVVVLVVAADDGIMPQTQEAIDHAKAAEVPIIVAINKIDKADANPDRVKQELAERDLTPEDWGGTTVTVPVSAKNRDNLNSLLEMILLVTELGEHKANPTRAATGTVLEAKVDRGRGPVATILVQDGTLHVGDNFIAGVEVGRVRALLDDRLQKTREVGPSSPVEVLGLNGLPQPGDAFQAVTDAAKARQIAVLRQNQAKEKALGGRGQKVTLESLQQQLSDGETKELPIVIKADVQGTAEVLAHSIGKLGDERVKTVVIRTAVGAISESDVLLASTSNAIVIGFNVRPDRNATSIAEREGVDIRLHSVIYDITDELKKAMAGLLEPTTKETQLGQAEIRDTFKVPKFGTAGGCMVTEGIISRSGDAQARLIRDGVVVHEGRIGSLRRFKDDVTEVKSGLECGIAFERFSDVKIGDVVESFTVEKIAATV